ncbi:restriction endonuclease subunit S [Vibrio atlanticus]|uniref:Type I restriction enzyme EcoKI, S subunit n=1 Tax=Vibrio atlanticus (strain LGP32) TaxID=575788 RepID=B7VNG6_VIBA3|nr:restriction endonuclease subunit S [Vibrio atlanticus]CAV18542.1 Type I restriction enzyme EcoKI, S subunit [Vibrio atlanticus]
MSELPKGWIACTPSDLANDPKNEIVDGPFGSNLKASEYTDEGTPIVRIQNVKRMAFLNKNIKYVTDEKAEFLKRHSFKSGDLLLTKLGEPLGLTCIAPEYLNEGIIVADIVRLRPNPEVNRKCLAYLLNSEGVIKQINAHTKGSTRARINLSVVRNLNINLPPLAEQKRIVEKIDEVLAQVDTIKARLDGIPDLLKRFRQSVLTSAVSGKLTEEWREEQDAYPTLNELKATIEQERFEIWCSAELNKKISKGKPPANDKWKEKYQPGNPKHNDSNKRTAVEEIKAPWLLTSLDAVSILTTGKTPSTAKDEYWNGDTMFVSPAQIHPEGYLHNPSRYVSKAGCQIVPLISKGSTLIVCIGTVGKVGLLTEDVVINQQINAITPLPSVTHKYMYYWCKTLYPWIIDTARATVNAAILNKSTMSTAPFALPPLEEQKEIVRLVDQYFAFADTIEAQVKKAQARVDNLTQSILAKAFRGELVAQDPNDEPADKLLARIAEARKEAEALAKAAKKAEAAKKRAAKSA